MVAQNLSRLRESDFQNKWFSILFYMWARESSLVSFLTKHFDVIRTKKAEMEPVAYAGF